MEGIDLNNMSMEEKVNLILTKAISNENKIDDLRADLTQQMTDIKTSLTKRIDSIDTRVTDVENCCSSNSKDISATNSEVAFLREEIQKLKINETNNGVHFRRFNLICGNLLDNGGWEPQGTSIAKVREFLRSLNLPEYDDQGIQVDDWNPDAITIKEAHRLPQDPSKFNFFKVDERVQGPPKRRNRLMVVRFECFTDIGMILNKCKHLQTINASKPKYYRQFVDRHYPKSVQLQKEDLKDEFKTLKDEGKKPSFYYDISTATMKVTCRKKE